MKKLVFLLLAVMMLTACTPIKENDREVTYMNITAEEAKRIMDTEEGYIILDVREQDEYDAGHIPGAILISYTQIKEKALMEEYTQISMLNGFYLYQKNYYVY